MRVEPRARSGMLSSRARRPIIARPIPVRPILHEGRCTVRSITSIALGISLLMFGAWGVALAGQGATAQTHIGHVLDSFNGTPMNMGLLPTAMAEAKTAAQHAGLAAKATTLAMVQTHAGHVINAIDPTIVAQGPGAGYGLKKAAQGVAQHATLA